MFDRLLGFHYRMHNVGEWAHALARIFIFVVGIVFGGHGTSSRAKSWRSESKDRKHRVECEKLGIFPEVWLNRRETLSDEQREILLRPSDEDIRTCYRAFLVQ